MQLNNRKFAAIVTIIATLGIFVGGGCMYFYGRMNNKVVQYSSALDVSRQLINNCYDAFYVTSMCSTEKGCDVVLTARSLSRLNRERKILDLKLNSLLEASDFPRSE